MAMTLNLTETSYDHEDFVEVDLADQELGAASSPTATSPVRCWPAASTRRTTFTRCRFVGAELYSPALGQFVRRVHVRADRRG